MAGDVTRRRVIRTRSVHEQWHYLAVGDIARGGGVYDPEHPQDGQTVALTLCTRPCDGWWDIAQIGMSSIDVAVHMRPCETCQVRAVELDRARAKRRKPRPAVLHCVSAVHHAPVPATVETPGGALCGRCAAERGRRVPRAEAR